MSDPTLLQTPPAAPPQPRVPETPEGFWTPDLVENRELASILSNSSTSITKALEISKDPQDTLDRVVSSAWMAHRMDLPFEYTMQNYDAVAKNYWGDVVPPKSARQAIAEAWQSSSVRQKIYAAQFQRLMGQGTPELDDQVTEWKRQLPSSDTEQRKWYVEIAKAAADMLPYQWEATKAAVPAGIAGAGLSAAIGAAAGPASEFSIPAAAVGGFLRGMALGSRAFTFQSEAGATFDTLLDMGVREDLARAISIPIGAGKAALEAVELANIPGLKGLKQDLEHLVSRDLSRELLEKGLISKIAKAAQARVQGPIGKGFAAFGVEYGVKGLGVEPATEVAQEALDMFAEAAGKAWNKAATGKDIPQATAQQSWDRLWQTWKQTAMAMVATGLPGSAMTALKTTGRGLAEQAADRRIAAEPKTAEGVEPVTLTEQAPAAAEILQTSANAEEGSLLRPEASAQHTVLIAAPDGTSPDGSRTVGRLEYRSDARSADILTLQMVPGQEQHARDSILELMKQNAGKEIHWDPTDAAGIALREELVNENPRRAALQSSIDELTAAHEQQQASLATAADDASRTAIAADMGRLEAEIDRLRRRAKRIGLQWYAEAPLTEESTVSQLQQAQETAAEDPWRLNRQQFAEQAAQAQQTETERALFADPARKFLASAFPGWSRSEVDVAGTLLDLRSQRMGLSTQAWMDKYLAPGMFKRWQGSFLPAEVFSRIEPDAFTFNQAKIAATEFLQDGRALLHLSESADFTTLVHELAHVFRRQLSDQDAAAAAQWAGATEGWTRDAEEKWARGLEDHLRDGTVPAPELANIFQQFAEWLKRIYQVLSTHVELSPEIRRVYDRLFTAQEEEKAASPEKTTDILFQPGESAETPSSRLNRLVNMPAVAIETPDAWKASDLPSLRRLARAEYQTLQPVTNTDSGRTVRFVQTGFKELQRHSATRDVMEIVSGLRELASKAVFLWEQPDRRQRKDTKAWHSLAARAVLNGREIYVRLVAWEEHKELFVDLFHDADITDAEKVRGLLQSAVLLPMQATTETSPADHSARDKLLQWIRAVKSGELSDTAAQTRRVLEDAAFRDWFAGSQATDAQGRPQVFYHGTYATFGGFEQSRDLGYHFGSSEQAAARIGGENAREGARVIPVYLSVKNPLRLSEDVFSRFDQVPMAVVADVISQAAGLDEQQATALYNQAAHVAQLRDTLGPQDERYLNAQERFWNQVQRALEAKGYDGVVYPNAVEGRQTIGRALLRQEGISEQDADELLAGRKSVHQVVHETLGIHEAPNRQMSSGSLGITEDLEEYQSHRSAINAAYEQASNRVGNILGGRLPDGSGVYNESWIAFQSNQVKSIFNKGTWSQSPNVLFQEGPDDGQASQQSAEETQSAEAHQAATEEAVKAGEAVPEEVLQEYKDTDWGKRELAARKGYIKDANSFDTFDEFTTYANAMATPDEPVHATEYWSMIWDQAQNEKTLDRRTANEQFLSSLTKPQLEGILEEAAYKDKLGGLHNVMQAVAKRIRSQGGLTHMSDAAYEKIMAQVRDDPTRYRALFAEITGDEEAIRQLIQEREKPQKENLEERLRRQNRELRQQVKAEESKVAAAARQARLEHSYSGDLEKRIQKIQKAHEEKVVQMKEAAAQRLKDQAVRSSQRGRERIQRIRDTQALSREKQRGNRKVREQFNKKIKVLERIQREIPYMHPDAKGPLTALLDDILLKRTSTQRKLRLEEIRAQFESHPEYEIPDGMKETLAELDKKSVRDMTVSEFDTLYNAVLHYAHRNKEIQAQRIGSERLRQDDVLSRAYAELRRSKPIESDQFSEEGTTESSQVVGDEQRVRRGLRKAYDTFIGIGQDHYNLIVERIAGKDSILYRLFVRSIEEGRRAQLLYKQRVHARFQADIATLGVDNITTWLNELTPVDRFHFTRGERMALWMHAQNEDNFSSILHAGFGLKRRDGDERFTFNDQAELQKVLDSVTEQEKVFTEAAHRLFEQQGKDLAVVFLEKNGYELPIVENYYPKEVMAIGRGTEATVDDALERFRGVFMRVGISKGMLKARKNVDVPLYLNNIAYDIEKSVSRAGAYVGFEMPLTHASRLLYDKGFREQLSKRFSSRLWKSIEDGLRDIAGEFKEIDSTERALLKVRSGLTMAFLGFNPFSMLKQPLSLGNALPFVKARYLVQGLAETIGRGKEIFDMHRANSPYFTERLEVGFTRDIADAARVHSEGRLYGARTAAQRYGFLGIKSADAFTVASVMRGAWLQAMAELESGTLSTEVSQGLDLQGRSIMNLSVEDRNTLAYKYADYVSTRSQDQALPEYRSSLSRSRWGKFFTMFGSSSNVALNLLRRSILDTRTGGEGAVRRLALTVLAVGVLGPAGEAAVNMLRSAVRGAFAGEQPPDDERLRTFIGDYIQNVGGLMYFVRDATNRAINAWQYGPFMNNRDTSNPIALLTDTIQSTIAEGVRAISEDDYLQRRRLWTQFIDDFALAASLLSQMPLYMPTKALTRAFGEPARKKER